MNAERPPKKDHLTRSDQQGGRTPPPQEEDDEDDDEENPAITFNPSVTEKAGISDCFRIFVDPCKITNEPATRQPPARGLQSRMKSITLYTDGSCLNNGKENATSGSGVWFGEESEHNMALRVPGTEHSNQIGEVAAVVAALEKTPNFIPLQ